MESEVYTPGLFHSKKEEKSVIDQRDLQNSSTTEKPDDKKSPFEKKAKPKKKKRDYLPK